MAELTKAKVRYCDLTSDLTRLICKISPDLLLGTTAKREFNTKAVSQGFVFDAGWLSIGSLIQGIPVQILISAITGSSVTNRKLQKSIRKRLIAINFITTWCIPLTTSCEVIEWYRYSTSILYQLCVMRNYNYRFAFFF